MHRVIVQVCMYVVLCCMYMTSYIVLPVCKVQYIVYHTSTGVAATAVCVHCNTDVYAKVITMYDRT